MARVLSTVAGRLVLIALVMHAVLLPALMNAVLYVVRGSNVDQFVSEVRIHGRFVADMIAGSGAIDDDAKLIDALDSAVLSSDGVYAELRDGERTVLSSLVAPEDRAAFKEDLYFGEHDDGVYFVSIPLQIPKHNAILRLGFNEQATLDSIALARERLFWILGAYLAAALLVVAVLSAYLTRPLRVLRRASQTIASGQYGEQLIVNSSMIEINQLAKDLELMRSKLVGVNRMLEGEIMERKAVEEQREVLEAQLRHAQKLETVGTLAGGIAHEFNNILVPIMLYSEIVLQDAGPDSATGQNAARVLRAANRAKALVQQILAFSHQSGPGERRPMQVGPIVQEVVQFLRALLPASIAVRGEVDMQAGVVMADSAEIHQLVTNLCNNAYQALESDGGCVRIEVARQDVGYALAQLHPDLREGPYVVISVADDGQGIDPVARQRIFEPFFTTRPVGEGTGLGLAVAHGIATGHEGTILVESKLGHGSLFLVYLPIYTGPESQLATRRAVVAYLPADATAAAENAQGLRALGHDVTVLSGDGDLHALRNTDTAWDVVIAERQTLEAVDSWMKSRARRPPLILLLSLGDIISRAEQDGYGVSSCLVKPVEVTTIAACIAQLLRGENAHG